MFSVQAGNYKFTVQCSCAVLVSRCAAAAVALRLMRELRGAPLLAGLRRGCRRGNTAELLAAMLSTCWRVSCIAAQLTLLMRGEQLGLRRGWRGCGVAVQLCGGAAGVADLLCAVVLRRGWRG